MYTVNINRLAVHTMPNMLTTTMRLDPGFKRKANQILEPLGMTMIGAVNRIFQGQDTLLNNEFQGLKRSLSFLSAGFIFFMICSFDLFYFVGRCFLFKFLFIWLVA